MKPSGFESVSVTKGKKGGGILASEVFSSTFHSGSKGGRLDIPAVLESVERGLELEPRPLVFSVQNEAHLKTERTQPPTC